MKRDEIIAKATELINGDRKEDYGDAYLNHMRIAEFWNNYLDHEIKITPTDAAMMMLLDSNRQSAWAGKKHGSMPTGDSDRRKRRRRRCHHPRSRQRCPPLQSSP